MESWRNRKTLILGRSDMIGLLTPAEYVDCVEHAFRMHGLGRVYMEPKGHIVLDRYRGEWEVMPSWIEEPEAAACKWVSIREDNGKYELTVYWPSLARQYRIQGIYHWIAASEVPDEYAVRPWRAKVWDWLHAEVPQSSPAPDRSSFVTKFESCGAELERRFGGQEAVPPAANAGLVCLEPRRVEVQQIDAERRLHDRRLFICERAMWTQEILVP